MLESTPDKDQYHELKLTRDLMREIVKGGRKFKGGDKSILLRPFSSEEEHTDNRGGNRGA
jgi:hypothetical protein